MRILFASGGTGGHIYPGLTLAKELLARGEHEVLFVGTKRGLEGELVRREGYPLRFIQSAPLTGGLLKKGASLFQITRGVFEAKRLLSEFKPTLWWAQALCLRACIWQPTSRKYRFSFRSKTPCLERLTKSSAALRK